MIDYEAQIRKDIFALDNLLTLNVRLGEDNYKHIFEKFFLIRNRLVRYYELYRNGIDFYNNTNDVRYNFCCNLDETIECVEFYKKNIYLTKEHMNKLNKIYKRLSK